MSMSALLPAWAVYAMTGVGVVGPLYIIGYSIRQRLAARKAGKA